MARIHEESPLLIIGYGLCLMLFKPLDDRQDKQSTPLRLSIGLGIIVACGIMTKMTFIPVLLLVLLLIQGKRARITYLASSILTMSAWAVLLIPRFDYYISWIVGLAIHTEAYGKGDIGLMDIDNLKFIETIILDEPIYSLLLLCSASLATWKLISSLRRERSPRCVIHTLSQPLCLLCYFQVGFFVIILKQPNIHYLSPALPFLALTIVCYFDNARLYCSRLHRHASLLAIVVIGLCLTLLGVRYQLAIAEAQQNRTQSAAAESFTKALPATTIVANAYGSSNQTFALIFGDIFAGSHYESHIKEIYSDHLWFSVWASRFYIERSRVHLSELAPIADTIIVQGSNMRPPSDGLPGSADAVPFKLYKQFGNETLWIQEIR